MNMYGTETANQSTERVIGAYWQIVRNGTTAERSQAVLKLRQIIATCEDEILNKWARAAMEYASHATEDRQLK